MNWLALLGIVMVAYSIFVFYVVLRKPEKVWDISKIQGFVKALGVRGTEVVFILFGLILGGLGVWFLIK